MTPRQAAPLPLRLRARSSSIVTSSTQCRRQPVDVVADRRGALLDAPVPLVDLLMRQEFRRLGRIVQVLRHVLVQAVLVALQRQRVVASLGDDRRRRAALRVKRVGGHRVPLRVEQFQQFRQRRNLVRLAVHHDLRQRQLRLRRER